MPATLQHIPLDALKVSRLNVRKHGAKDEASLASSIAALLILTCNRRPDLVPL